MREKEIIFLVPVLDESRICLIYSKQISFHDDTSFINEHFKHEKFRAAYGHTLSRFKHIDRSVFIIIIYLYNS